MDFHDFLNFHENRIKVRKGPAAAHHAQTLFKPMVFHRYFRPLEPESGKSAKKCHFHQISAFWEEKVLKSCALGFLITF